MGPRAATKIWAPHAQSHPPLIRSRLWRFISLFTYLLIFNVFTAAKDAF